MTTVQIKHRYTDAVLFECEVPEQHRGMSMRYALEQANKNDADLYAANLRGANLYAANLRGAELRDADLRDANLRAANLRGAELRGANLYGAELRDAELRDTNLYGAKIDGETVSINPISMTGLRWSILITDGFMRIGCQRHAHDAWESFGDAEIGEMDSNAPEFWSQWREPLLAMCKAHASKVAPITQS